MNRTSCGVCGRAPSRRTTRRFQDFIREFELTVLMLMLMLMLMLILKLADQRIRACS